MNMENGLYDKLECWEQSKKIESDKCEPGCDFCVEWMDRVIVKYELL